MKHITIGLIRSWIQEMLEGEPQIAYVFEEALAGDGPTGVSALSDEGKMFHIHITKDAKVQPPPPKG